MTCKKYKGGYLAGLNNFIPCECDDSASGSNDSSSSKDSESYRQKYLLLSAQYCREIDEYGDLLKLIHDDLKMRANKDGVVDISNFIWEKLEEWLER